MDKGFKQSMVLVCGWFYEYLGARYLKEKFVPPSNEEKAQEGWRPPSGFFVWALSLYIAIYGITESRFLSAASITG